MFVQKSRILGLSFAELQDRIRGEEVRTLDCFRPPNFDLTHVADIEQADGVADSVVLLDDARVLYWHVPAAEIHHLGAHAAMYRIEGRGLERRGRGHEQRP